MAAADYNRNNVTNWDKVASPHCFAGADLPPSVHEVRLQLDGQTRTLSINRLLQLDVCSAHM